MVIRRVLRSPVRRRLAAVGVGLLADRALGEPAVVPHPVAAFGSAMRSVERSLRPGSRAAGVVHAAAGVAIGAGAGAAVRSTALATYVAAAGRCLGDEARGVGASLVRGDLPAARLALPALVSRDPSGLDEAAIARAAVESVAENTVDAVVASAFWAVVGGGPGALAHRAANTMDAMVGYRDERYARYGWASARLDDALAWVPARLTAVLVAAVRPRAAAEVWRAVREDAPAHPSPNAGVAEAAAAAALGLRLGGPSTYGGRVEERPVLGRGDAPGPADVERAVRLLEDVTLALALGLLALAVVPVGRRP